MSQQPQPIIINTQPQSNGLGVAGFVISLVGFLTCGLISPLGLLFSFIGLFKPPRGLAVAGFVLGLIGSWWLVFFGSAMVLGFVGLGAAVDEATRQMEIENKRMLDSQEMVDPATESPSEGARDTSNGTPPQKQPDGLIIKNEDRQKREEALAEQEDERKKALAERKRQEGMAERRRMQEAAEKERLETEKKRQEEEREAEFRNWTDSSGTYTVEARYMKNVMGTITLEKRDGTTIELRLDRLSDEDQEFIKNRKK